MVGEVVVVPAVGPAVGVPDDPSSSPGSAPGATILQVTTTTPSSPVPYILTPLSEISNVLLSTFPAEGAVVAVVIAVAVVPVVEPPPPPPPPAAAAKRLSARSVYLP